MLREQVASRPERQLFSSLCLPVDVNDYFPFTKRFRSGCCTKFRFFCSLFFFCARRRASFLRSRARNRRVRDRDLPGPQLTTAQSRPLEIVSLLESDWFLRLL